MTRCWHFPGGLDGKRHDSETSGVEFGGAGRAETAMAMGLEMTSEVRALSTDDG